MFDPRNTETSADVIKKNTMNACSEVSIDAENDQFLN